MPKLSVKNLDEILTMPLDEDLARWGRTMSNEDAKDRIRIALHEAAHLVAAVACNSSVRWVEIYVPHKSKNLPGGRIQSYERRELDSAFVSLAGYAWEKNFGNTNLARSDWERALSESRPYDVEIHDLLIQTEDYILGAGKIWVHYAAVGILGLCTVKGVLAGRRMQHLFNWLKPKIPKYQLPHRPVKAVKRLPTSTSDFPHEWEIELEKLLSP